jgi:MarR family transcriptional regulator, temperature-dependent positive regulator of motility
MLRQSKNASELDDKAEALAGIYGMPGHVIRRMHQTSTAIFDAQMAKAGIDLTSVQFAALTVIGARPGLDQATLASAIVFDRATTGGVIDRLEAKGFVRREIAKGDRRSRRLYLEPEGESVLEGAAPVVKRVQDMMLEGLSANERETFMSLLTKALQAAGDASRRPAAAIPAIGVARK